MESIKRFLNSKRYGFYVTSALIALSVVTAIVYAVSYGKYASMMSWSAFVFLLVGAAGAVALIVLKRAKWAYAPPAIGAFIALLLFIKHIYNYVAVVVVGIDLSGISGQFLVCTVFFALTFLVSVVNIFLAQEKEENE